MDIILNEFLLASAASPEGQPQGMGLFGCIMSIAFLGIFYALLIRPQQQQQKEHEKLVSEIKSGDRVVAAGMVGMIITVKKESVTLRTGESKIEVVRNSVERVLTDDESSKD